MPLRYVTTLPTPPARPEESHKGSFGKALIIAGSRGMSGAACLAGLGALRGGAGLVTVAIPIGIASIVASVEPSYLTHPLPEDCDGRLSGQSLADLLLLCEKSTAIGFGSGWGTSSDLQAIALALFTSVTHPIVADADALNLLAKTPGGFPPHPADAPRIITPHPGEFGRLLGLDTAAVQKDRETLAVEFARKHNVIVLLKGHATVITDGERVAVNTTGNSGMATGGTGDVLTGLITALLAQKMPPFEAAQLGAHLHGLAGDLAASERARPGLIASDLPRFLPRAWEELPS